MAHLSTHGLRTHDLLSERCQWKVYRVPLVLVVVLVLYLTLSSSDIWPPTSNFETIGQGFSNVIICVPRSKSYSAPRTPIWYSHIIEYIWYNNVIQIQTAKQWPDYLKHLKTKGNFVFVDYFHVSLNHLNIVVLKELISYFLSFFFFYLFFFSSWQEKCKSSEK